jgi:hypothetical protein
MNNMELWRKVCVTDPKAVKPITGKQYSGNSPKPYWVVERLTSEFGPCGIGWGFNIVSERIERFGDTDSLHIAVVRFWYEFNGKRGELEQIGQTKTSYLSSKDKFILDEDAPKKSVTDALIKCASYLGFAGDIFSGRWDDSKYVQEAAAEWERRKREDSPERLQWIADWCAAIDSAASSEELKATYSDAIASAKEMSDADAEGQFMAARATRIAKAKAQPQKEAA